MDPLKSARGIQLAVTAACIDGSDRFFSSFWLAFLVRVRAEKRGWALCRCISAAAGECTFPGWSATTGFRGGQKHCEKVARLFFSFTRPFNRGWVAKEGESVIDRRFKLLSLACKTEGLQRLSARLLRRSIDWGGLLCQCSPTANCPWFLRTAQARRRVGSVAIRSALHPTRLETRTKESNMCASHGVIYEARKQAQ